MTASSFHDLTETTPSTGDALIHESETSHICCCRHPDTTLCGLDVGDAEDCDEDEVDCIVCNDLMDNAPEQCPVRPFCPLYVVPA